MARPFQIVFLDVGETLTYPHPSFHEIIARALARHGYDVSPQDVERVEGQVWADIEDRRKQGQAWALSGPETQRFWLDAYHLFLHHLGVSEAGDLPRRLVDEFLKLETWRLYPDVEPAIHALRQAGYRLGVISNWEEWLEDLLISLGVHEHFDLVVYSARENVAKPDPLLYRRAVEAAGVAPREAVHVGDDPVRDVAPARSVGLTPVLVDRRGRYPDVDCLRVTDLRQVPELLAARRP